MIIAHARRLWHTKVSKITFKELIGQKVKAIDSEIHFIIQLEKEQLSLKALGEYGIRME